jgi:hypothetical protein
MFLFLDESATGGGQAKKLLELYHADMAQDIPGFAEEYTVQMMIDDMAMYYWAFMGLAISMNDGAIKATKAGLLPKEKADFTWEVLMPTICKRITLIVADLELAPILRTVLDGSYDRWSGAEKK